MSNFLSVDRRWVFHQLTCAKGESTNTATHPYFLTITNHTGGGGILIRPNDLLVADRSAIVAFSAGPHRTLPKRDSLICAGALNSSYNFVLNTRQQPFIAPTTEVHDDNLNVPVSFFTICFELTDIRETSLGKSVRWQVTGCLGTLGCSRVLDRQGRCIDLQEQ